MVGGTIAAAAAALEDGRAAHLGGGLHHAFANHGEGFCPLNDVAVAIARVLQGARARAARRSSISTSTTATAPRSSSSRDPRVFTFSMHQQHNYPLWKPRGDRSTSGCADGAHDERFCAQLGRRAAAVMDSRPDLVFYLAGADPFEKDRLGGLRLTKRPRRARPAGHRRGGGRRRAAGHRPRRRLRGRRERHRRHSRHDDRDDAVIV